MGRRRGRQAGLGGSGREKGDKESVQVCRQKEGRKGGRKKARQQTEQRREGSSSRFTCSSVCPHPVPTLCNVNQPLSCLSVYDFRDRQGHISQLQVVEGHQTQAVMTITITITPSPEGMNNHQLQAHSPTYQVGKIKNNEWEGKGGKGRSNN